MNIDLEQFRHNLNIWANELGLAGISVSRGKTQEAAPHLQAWLDAKYHGDMSFMTRHADLRLNPHQLHPGTMTVISARHNYWPNAFNPLATLQNQSLAYISRYALGRDYHKVLRQKLQKLATQMTEAIGPFSYRVFSDSAPVLEVEFAQQSGLGWRGKHSLLLTRQGSWHFLGEIYTDLPLPIDPPSESHCGRCTRCLDICPTQAIIAPYTVDARRCISYLTIEHQGSIPVELRPLIGNRIYGCDDCQLVCPWNRFANIAETEFSPRHNLDSSQIEDLLQWNENSFNERLAGSPIRRIGHLRWLRNLAIAAGNALSKQASPRLTTTLLGLTSHSSELVREHAQWALAKVTKQPE